jgi:hypothetical protein
MAKYIGSHPLATLRYWTPVYYYFSNLKEYYWENNPITGSPYLYESRSEANQAVELIKVSEAWIPYKVKGCGLKVVEVIVKPGDLEDDDIFKP